MTSVTVEPGGRRLPALDPQVVPAAVAVAGAVLFVYTGSRGVSGLDLSSDRDQLAFVALLLNIALILFAWRRHKEACSESAHRRTAEERARLLSTRDQLTGLLIRTSLIEEGREVLRVAQESGHSAVLIVLNLDRFKQVNELMGHPAGDALLRRAGEQIRELSGRRALCARTGADEFCVLCPMASGGETDIDQMTQRLLELLAQPLALESSTIHITSSAGLAGLEGDCASVESLLRRANIAITSAKKAGGGRAVWFDRSMESALKARNEVEAGLRRGIPLGEFVPFYQPQVDLRTGALCGFEALARWQHPSGGTVGPDVFIQIAEETGLIGELFESICAQALTDAREWPSRLTVSVNISPGQLKDPWLSHKILRLLAECNFPAERLEIEITESSLFENLDLAQAIVTSLKNHGVKLALDDFGTGYSSLANLRALPFDRMKIDRGFVQAMENDQDSLAIVTAIARMGESLRVPVTAEGVTSEAVREQLLKIGCDIGQGWHFGKPAPASETLGAVEREQHRLQVERLVPRPGPARARAR